MSETFPVERDFTDKKKPVAYERHEQQINRMLRGWRLYAGIKKKTGNRERDAIKEKVAVTLEVS